MNTYGTIYRLTSFGASHGPAIGGIIDGCEPGLEVDRDYILHQLARRKPGQSKVTTERKESDEVEFLSGIYENTTTGTPIGFLIRNKDHHSADYDHLKDIFRPSHADYTYQAKYGIRDHRGGGRSSARETAARVVGGAIARIALQKRGVSIAAYVSRVGNMAVEKPYTELNLTKTDNNIVRCPDAVTAKKMITLIEQIKNEGDTIGGIITCVIQGAPAGLGEPVFDKLHAELGKAMLSINAVKGFEYGSGFSSAGMKGSEHNDAFAEKNGKIMTVTNHSGGIQGGISNGQDIYFNTVFKPVATIKKPQQTVNKDNEPVTMQAKGRHDPCVLPRAVPIVEAMAGMVVYDFLLRIGKDGTRM